MKSCLLWLPCVDNGSRTGRHIQFIKMVLKSDNVIVRTKINVGLKGTHFIMGGN